MKPSVDLDDLPGKLPSYLVADDVDLEEVRRFAQQTLECLNPEVLDSSALWKDWLALTGQVRTFYSSEKITNVWKAQVKKCNPTSFITMTGRVTKPAPGSSWVDIPFKFTIYRDEGLVGDCTGTASFISDAFGKWRMWLLVTVLENFAGLGHPDVPRAISEAVINRGSSNITNVLVSHEESFHTSSHQFDVVVVGAGQCGLAMGGRLGALGLKYVVLEKRPSVGNNWTQRYESVRQHTVREYNNLPFERTWKSGDPLLLPGKIVAEGFENYVQKYDINLWTNVTTVGSTWSPQSRTWTLNVLLNGNEKHELVCQHLVIAIGAGVSVDNDPKIPGTDEYKGILVHSGAYKHSRDWACKDGIVIGSGTSAHDIAQDMYRAGLRSVTMTQRSKTAIYPIEWVIKGQEGLYNEQIPTKDADAMVAGRPNKILRDILRTNYEAAAKLDQGRFEALEKAGFRVDRETPMMDNILMRYGGYYIDIGASTHIARGEIKVKSGVRISNFTSEGLKFEDDTELRADVVVIATGQDHDYRNQVGNIVGQDFAARLGEFWGLDEDGEVRNVMKPAAPGLWMFGGTAAQARWWSRFIALSIQSDKLGKPIECVKMVE